MDNRYWSKRARSYTPYIPGEQPKILDLIKLNTNECPYPPSPRVIKAIQDAAGAKLRLYPEPESEGLRDAIAARHGVKRENVFVGNGSDEVLAVAFGAFFDDGVRFADITYGFYPVYCELLGIKPEIIPLNEDFTLPVERYLHSTGCVITTPNAPTGIPVAYGDLKRIAGSSTGAVVIDEAYVEFGGGSALGLINECDNAVIVKTYSKSHALAGMRLGYAIARPELIAALSTVKNSFNSFPVDRIAQAAGIAAMQDDDYYKNVSQKIISTREWTKKKLEGLGFTVLPSEANFVFAKHATVSGKKLASELRERAVLVRRFEKPRISDFLRITIGTDGEMERLIYCLEQILK